MAKTKSKSCIFIFRRDFRLIDNSALIKLVQTIGTACIVPVFLLNDVQIDPKRNAYFSQHAFDFMIASLHDLDEQLRASGGRLFVFRAIRGDECNVLRSIAAKLDVSHVAFNADATPFARERDGKIERWCADNGVQLLTCDSDNTMLHVGAATTNKGTTFEVFTPFYRKAMRIDVPKPKPWPQAKCAWHTSSIIGETSWVDLGGDVVGPGAGRHHALTILEDVMRGKCSSYSKHHDVPAKDATTRIGAFMKFGCVSPREVYHAAKEGCGRGSTLVQQLFWREFYYNLAIGYPEILGGQRGMQNTFVKGRFAKTSWNTDAIAIQRWREGRTGAPFVDAAMRCLNATGWLHNRGRMVVAMYLVRDMGVDWRVGERYFATKLVDYDPINNNQGWCWALSYRRKLSPFKQASRFDPNCDFIREWVHEFKAVPTHDIIAWDVKWSLHSDRIKYPKPMCDKKST